MIKKNATRATIVRQYFTWNLKYVYCRFVEAGEAPAHIKKIMSNLAQIYTFKQIVYLFLAIEYYKAWVCRIHLLFLVFA